MGELEEVLLLFIVPFIAVSWEGLHIWGDVSIFIYVDWNIGLSPILYPVKLILLC